MYDLKKIKDEFFTKLKGKLNLSEINQIKSDLFGKNGLVSSQFKKIGSIAETERKKFASDSNIVLYLYLSEGEKNKKSINEVTNILLLLTLTIISFNTTSIIPFN